jgi:hypothetical protein
MSYDFRLFSLPEEMSLDDYFEAYEMSLDEDIDSPPTDAQYEVAQSIVNALLEHNPTLRVFESESGIELSPDLTDTDLTGIVINLYSDEAAVSVPYWHSDEKARYVLIEIWDYLQVIQNQTGYLVYDAQLGRVIDLFTDFEESLQIYAYTVHQINSRFNPTEH